MKQERNIITMDEYGRVHFPSTTNNDIWMNTNELIELFGIKYSILRGNIKAIYKSGILDECEVQRCIKLSNGISIDVYALPMIVALSFRLNTLGAYKVRECVMNKLTTNLRNQILFLNVRTHECMNKSKYGLNWHYKIFCVNRNTGFRKESRIFYFIHLQNEEDYERKESSSA